MKEKQKTFELEPVQQLLPADAQQRVMDQLYQFMELEHLYESARSRPSLRYSTANSRRNTTTTRYITLRTA